MLVEKIMKKDVYTLPPTATIQEALELLNKKRIRHIPIIDEAHHIIGIVSDRDVRDATPSVLDKEAKRDVLKKPIRSIMSHPVVTIHPLDFVEDIARVFYDEAFGCLPVVSEGKLVGIVSDKDMLHTLIQLTGTHKQSSHIELKVPHQPGELAHIFSIFGKKKINIISLLIYPNQEGDEHKVVVIRAQTIHPQPIVEELSHAGYEIIWPKPLVGAE
ncbi:MAG TPA: CBS and ACT domain-containing protein [Cerasibacillus sp.]|uniref:CBS and ACT domain-containing protein n=1 Tax=Cerasibacillus sp. TaxID=2498711 RepID=UPI002F42049B